MYNLAIIGGGPAGYVAAERAGAKGLKVILFEKKELGGVCLNEGCIPTKTLLYSAKIYDNAKAGAKYGVNGDSVTFDFAQMMKRKDGVVRRLVGGIGFKMKSNKVEVVNALATIKSRTASGVEIEANGTVYQAENVLISTGSEAVIPPIKGVEEAGDIIVTNREVLNLSELPKSLVVIGGGVIGTEFASFFSSLGTEVTVIEMLPEILTGMDSELSGVLRKQLEKKGIKFNLQSKVTEIKGNEVIFEKDGKTETVKGEKILLSVGRRPNIVGIGLENVGVELFRNSIKVDEKMRTNIPNIYAAGDVTGFSLLAHTASREGEVVVNNLTGKKDYMRYNAIPGVIYTNPEFAGVGLTEEVAKEKGIKYKLSNLPMAYAGRFVTENEGGVGFSKVLIGEEHGEILGVHMLGNPSSEMIYGAVMAIESEMTIDEMQEVVFPHPTVSEILKENVFNF